PEIVKEHIIRHMLDDEEEAVKQFYALPFTQAFSLYHGIKVKLKDGTKPVGPLFAKSEKVREFILDLQKNPWYYYQPIVNFEDKEEIDSLPEDVRNIYLQGKEIFVLPDAQHNNCVPRTLMKNSLIGVIAGLVPAGLTTIGTMVVEVA